MRLADYNDRIEAGQAYNDAFQAARLAYGERMRARYPEAEKAWQAAIAGRPPAEHGGVDLVALMPWLPYDAPIDDGVTQQVRSLFSTRAGGVELPRPYFFPSPGPGNFNFGGAPTFASTGQGFAGDNWRDVIARGGGNPNAEYLSAFVQSPLAAAGKYDYAEVLYMRAGAFWRPIAAYGKGRTSSWVQFRDDALKPSLMVAAAFGAGAFLASQIGGALVGPGFAAANPGITSALGQTVLQTAVNGGDLGQAIKGAAMGAAGGFVGAQAGGLASSLTDSKLLADVANAAVSAAVQGGDVQTAVVRSLASTGASSLSDLFTPSQEVATVDYFDPVYDAPADIDFAAAPNVPASANSWELIDWSQTPPDASTWTDWDFNPGGLDPQAPVPATSGQSSGGGSGFDAAIVTLTNAAMAAIKINAAYQASQQPQLRTSTVSGSTVSTPNPNGTLTVRNTTTGQVATTRPQAGVPYTLTDGRTIINNGNGTYSLITRDGATQTIPYGISGAAAGVGFLDSLRNIPPAVWAIGAGVAIAALRSRR